MPEYFPAENDVSFALAEQNDWLTSIIVGVIFAISFLTAYGTFFHSVIYKLFW